MTFRRNPEVHMQNEPSKSRRLSLTKSQLQEDTGASLLALLNEIIGDGKLTDDEILRLHDWSAKNRNSDLPAVGFLADAIEGSIANGVVSDSDRLDLQLAIERVLPVTARGIAREARSRAEPSPEPAEKISREDLKKMTAEESDLPPIEPEPTWRDDPMTDPQCNFIKSLGGSISRAATKGQASDLIESLVGKKPISNRQQMVMRFWGRDRLRAEGPREISEWMDEIYTKDPDRKLAWELFKQECEDDGLQGDPGRVPFGIGQTYLARIKQGGAAAIPRFRMQSRGSNHNPSIKPQAASSTPPSRATFRVTGILYALAACVILGAVLSMVQQSPPRRSQTEPTSRPKIVPKERATTPAPSEATFVADPTSQKSQPTPDDSTGRFIMSLKLSGIIGGSAPRAILDSQLYRVGDQIDSRRGITIIRIDEKQRLVEFRDSSGQAVVRHLD